MPLQRGGAPSPWVHDNANNGADEQFRGLLEEKESVSAWMCHVVSMLVGDTRDDCQLM